MNITASFLLLFVFVLLYTAIIEIFTILFRLTGLAKDKARTQVISLLTNSGFTTSESEVVLHSLKRRKLAQVTMLFGYSFTVIIVSMIVNIVLSLSTSEVADLFPLVGTVAVSVLLLLTISRIKPMRALLDRCIERFGNRMMFGSAANPLMLVDIYGPNAVVEVMLEHLSDKLINQPLGQSGLRETMNIHILDIKRREEHVRIDGDTCLKPGDVVLVFGNYKNIHKVFDNLSVPKV